MHPEKTADFIQFYFVIRSLELWQNMFLEKRMLEFGFEKENEPFAALLPFDVFFGNKLKKIDFSLS